MEDTTKIVLSNGHALVRNQVTRKAMRLYRSELFKDAGVEDYTDTKTGELKTRTKISPNALDGAYDILVRNMVVGAEINGKEIGLDDDFFDNLPVADFDLILAHCDDLVEKAATKKKE